MALDGCGEGGKTFGEVYGHVGGCVKVRLHLPDVWGRCIRAVQHFTDELCFDGLLMVRLGSSLLSRPPPSHEPRHGGHLVHQTSAEGR